LSFLPKEKIPELGSFLEEVLLGDGRTVWKKFFDKLGGYFNKLFGPDWMEKDQFFMDFKEEMLKQEAQR